MPKHSHKYQKAHTHAPQSGSATQCLTQVSESDSGFTGGRAADANGECAPHNNMPPYKPVLYLIKIKDER